MFYCQVGAVLFSIASLTSASAVAAAAPQEPGPAFAQQPESDNSLAASVGGAARNAAGYRALVEPEALGYLQLVGRTSGVAMDNWWSQTGAALIGNNLLATR